MLDDLRGLVIFAEVVDAKSFARAAAHLGMTRSAVSKHVAQLEAQLGVQLLSRTTRKLSLTEVGERVYGASKSVRESAELAREAAHTHQGSVEGTVRVTAPVGLGRAYLVPLARELMALHPQLEISMILSDSYVDLVEERIDVALRVGRAIDSTLVARRVASVGLSFCASPAYLREHGVPKRPSDLAGGSVDSAHHAGHAAHQWMQHTPSPEGGRVTLTRAGRSVQVRASGRLSCNDGPTLAEAAVLGLGIFFGPDFEVASEVRAGRLVRVLTGWVAPGMTLHAVSPPRRHVSSKVRTFIDFVSERWSTPPWRLS